tara:strand:- start:2328 stop:3236 length:909 start_codon:yes stop_codon:yes gene_type:complete
MMHSKWQSLLTCHLAALILSFTALFAKLIQFPAYAIIFWRCIYAALVLALFIVINREFKSIKGHYLGLFIMAICMCLHWVSLFYAIQVSTVAIGVISVFTFPLWTVLLDAFFLQKQLNKRYVILAVLLIVSVLGLVPDLAWDNQATQGIAWGVFSAVTFSIRNILSQQYIKQFSAAYLMAIQCIVTSLVLFPFIATSNLGFPMGLDWIYLLILGVFVTAVGHTLFVSSFKVLSAGVASLIASSQPVYSIILAYFILAETPTLRILMGGMGIIVIVTLSSYWSMKSLTTLPKPQIEHIKDDRL